MAKPAKKKFDRTAPLTIEEAQTKSKDERSKKCRYCTNTKDAKRFYKSYDFIDTDGKLSICIDCCTHLFNYFYSLHSRIDISIYEVCKVTNVRYDSKAFSSLIQALEKNSMQATINAINGEEVDDNPSTSFDEVAVSTKTSLFGKYLTILSRIYANKEDDLFFDLYSSDRPDGYEDKSTDKPIAEVLNNAYEVRMSSLEKKWGSSYTDDDYSFLESEYNGWAKTKDVDEKSIDTLIKEVCSQQLVIRRKREEGSVITKDDIATLTSLMDKCNITPNIMKESSSQKMAASWGAWVKDVETLSPAEWVENQKMFKDVEGIEEYVDRHFGRSLRNYVGMSRDFRIVSAKLEEEASGADFSDIAGIEDREVNEEEDDVDAEQDES